MQTNNFIKNLELTNHFVKFFRENETTTLNQKDFENCLSYSAYKAAIEILSKETPASATDALFLCANLTQHGTLGQLPKEIALRILQLKYKRPLPEYMESKLKNFPLPFELYQCQFKPIRFALTKESSQRYEEFMHKLEELTLNGPSKS